MTMTKLVQAITSRWSQNGIIDKADEDIYNYGLQLILFTSLNFAVTSVTAIIVGRFRESTILLATFIPIQAYGGGYHAKTHLRCFLTMYIGWWMAIFIALPILNPTVATIASIFALVVIFVLAPVPHINVRMSVQHRTKLRNRVRICALLFVLISLILIHFISTYSYIGVTMVLGIALSAFSMLIAYAKNKINPG